MCATDDVSSFVSSAGLTETRLLLYSLTQHCPEPNGFCCSVSDPIDHIPILMTKHILMPYQVLPPPSDLPKPYNAEAGHYEEEDLPFISTITETINTPPEVPLLTPNFFDILLQNDCLPSDKKCSDCLRNKSGANCRTCADKCPCYCKTLCHIPVEQKFISKELVVTPPRYSRDPSRLIPRIVHQTWFEDVDKEKYPNMSRLIESFKQSGWEYKFYTDDEAGNFLSTHFPSEVREAYDALRPGAFKADLFRYCVLMIHGGVYADMDIMLESNLDLAVAPDIGFMVPQDEVSFIHRYVKTIQKTFSHSFSEAWNPFKTAHVFVERFYCSSPWPSILGESSRDSCQQCSKPLYLCRRRQFVLSQSRAFHASRI